MNGVGLCLYELSINYVFGENSLLCGKSDKEDDGVCPSRVIGFCVRWGFSRAKDKIGRRYDEAPTEMKWGARRLKWIRAYRWKDSAWFFPSSRSVGSRVVGGGLAWCERGDWLFLAGKCNIASIRVGIGIWWTAVIERKKWVEGTLLKALSNVQ